MNRVIQKLKKQYIYWHANRIKFPEFSPSPLKRINVIFSGKVQNVGFRLEMFYIAKRLQFIGWVKNLDDGRVEAEIQGEEEKIQFLITCMKSLKRANVTDVITKELERKKDENDFHII